jgi:hypothetical protein
MSSEAEELREQRVVEARLGRAPQDMLEAAVVLEAWTGLRAREALAAGRRIMRSAGQERQRSAGDVPVPDKQERFAYEALAFIVAVIAIACWAGPLSRSLGPAAVERGVVVALPMTLALQWMLRSRYLGRPDGLVQLGRRPAALAALALGVVGVSFLLLGLGGWVAGLLTLTWTGGTVLIRRGWSLGYAAAVVAATGAMLAGVSAPVVLQGIAGVTTLAVAFALRLPEAPALQEPGRWGRALRAGLIGFGLGVILVADRSVDWSLGAVPALALLPSTAGSFWAGYHLWRFHHEIPKALSGIAVVDGDLRGVAWSPLRILLGAVGRLTLLTTLLSVLLVVGASRAGAETSGVSVLFGFGLTALATLIVSLLESVGRAFWALAAVIGAVAAEVAVMVLEVDPVRGSALIAGASLAVLVALPAAIALLSRPADTLATSLWIT